MIDLLPLVIVFPLVGVVILHFLGRRMGDPWAGWFAALMIASSATTAGLVAVPFFTGEAQEVEAVPLWDWIPGVATNFVLRWDALAALMVLLVTGMGTLVHLFAIRFMRGDDRFGRFFVYMNLFAFSMILLVLAGDFLMLFLGWELTGVSSYLLISFWQERPSATAAAKKAVVTTRLSDLGLLVALMLMFSRFGTFSFDSVLTRAGEVLDGPTATVLSLLLLLGAVGKPAQIPLHVWLSDAMEGPTPASAFLHGTTMVTAGVYLVVRAGAIFDLTPVVGTTMAAVGAVTALIAATISVAQTDIKRLLAYSTVSQVGLMFLALGFGGYAAGLFHLVTHGCFMSLLFLGAGSVILGMGGERDMKKMGGLRQKMPVTSVTMGVGALAIVGFPVFGGFWSENRILAVAFERGGIGYVFFGVAVLTAVITALAMARQWAMVFLGDPRWRKNLEPRESPGTMLVPLVILAIVSTVIGLVNTPWRLGLESFLSPVLQGTGLSLPQDDFGLFFVLAGVAVVASLIGGFLGFWVYRKPRPAWRAFERPLGRLWTFWEAEYRVDSLYGRTLTKPARRLSEFVASRLDHTVIDRGVEGVAGLASRAGVSARKLQTGNLRDYAAVFGVGLILVLAWVLGSVV